MTEYWFYHLETSMIKGVLPELLDKTRARGWRALVYLPEEIIVEFDKFLWTYKDDSFLPHGCDDEPMADQQPIILSHTAEHTKAFDCVFLIGDFKLEVSDNTQRCIIMIDGRDESNVMAARAKWKQLKDQNVNLSYWQQNDQGRWEQKN